MKKLRKIALITSASNFERQKNVINTVRNKLKEIGGCVLYVFTCYGVFLVEEADVYNQGAGTIYELVKKGSFDGCILEGNIGKIEMLRGMADIFRAKGVPVVTIQFTIDNVPSYNVDGYSACCRIMEHLIKEHHCTRINMVSAFNNDITTVQALKAYEDTLKKYDISFEEQRIVRKLVSVQNGRNIFHIFRERGTNDAQAVICTHDVYAIGLCLELEKNGYRVPEDLKLITLNYSTNSYVFSPQLSGADRGDCLLAEMACEGLMKLIDGEEIPMKNFASSNIFYGKSCGCSMPELQKTAKSYQELILAKVEAANQISRMMQYNSALEKVESLEELSNNICHMLQGINCQEFLFCLDSRTKQYVLEGKSKDIFTEGPIFDDTMIAMEGITEKMGRIENIEFSLEALLPFEPEENDSYVFLPVHNREQVYGYMVYVNELLPINLYNYRICHESIGGSIENLRRQMILKRNNQQLQELHMRDALTGLYNRFGLDHFAEKYTASGNYCVVMMDMDGLKGINDQFGHLAGNHALIITANAIKQCLADEEIAVRYGGDEFLVMSFNTDASYWDRIRIKVNEEMQKEVSHQKLSYELGISFGYCIRTNENQYTLDESYELSDKEMYKNKQERKANKQLKQTSEV